MRVSEEIYGSGPFFCAMLHSHNRMLFGSAKHHSLKLNHPSKKTGESREDSSFTGILHAGLVLLRIFLAFRTSNASGRNHTKLRKTAYFTAHRANWKKALGFIAARATASFTCRATATSPKA